MEDYEKATPYESGEPRPSSVRIRLRQHAGESATPLVQEGKKVKKGQAVGRVEGGKLGASVHASMDGKVRAVTADYVEIAG